MIVKQAVSVLVDGGHLVTDLAEHALDEIMGGGVDPALTGALLTALRLRGETVDEVVGLARAMRRHAVAVHTERRPLLDTCGTGGGGAPTINVSSAAAMVAAACGVAVAKHGNRAVTSKSGSADVLLQLGVPVDLSAEAAGRCLDEVGIAFLFATRLHPAMGHCAGVRRTLGFRTIFNLLGPLANPAGAELQLIGVPEAGLVDLVAESLRRLGTRRSWVVHGAIGLDELACEGPTLVREVTPEGVRAFDVTPADAGLPEHPVEAVYGSDAASNAADLLAVLDGQPGPKRDFIVLNSAAALLVGGRAADLAEAARLAEESIDSGRVRALLDAWRAFADRSESAPSAHN